jgi:hypothetical protein
MHLPQVDNSCDQFIRLWSIVPIIVLPYQRDFEAGENPASVNSQSLKKPKTPTIFYATSVF